MTKKGERPGSRLTELLDPAVTSETRVNLCVWRPPSWKFRVGRAVFVWAPDAEDFAQRKITDELWKWRERSKCQHFCVAGGRILEFALRRCIGYRGFCAIERVLNNLQRARPSCGIMIRRFVHPRASSRFIRLRESLGLYKSFNTVWCNSRPQMNCDGEGGKTWVIVCRAVTIYV